jgi:hypothetical protein
MPDHPYEFTLTREAAVVLDALAKEKGDNWRKRHVATHKIDVARTDYEIDRVGTWGEYAVCALLGIPFNWSTDRADDGIDGILWKKTIQIKTTEPPKRMMLFQDMNHFSTDVAILALVTMATRKVRIAGWISRKDFLKNKPMRREMRALAADKKERPVVPLENLRPITTLMSFLHPDGEFAGMEEPEDLLELIP